MSTRRRARIWLGAAVLTAALAAAGLTDASALEVPSVTATAPTTTVGSVSTPSVTVATPPVTVSPAPTGAVPAPPVPTPVPTPTGVPTLPPVSGGRPTSPETRAATPAANASGAAGTPAASAAAAATGRTAAAPTGAGIVRRPTGGSKGGPGGARGTAPATARTGSGSAGAGSATKSAASPARTGSARPKAAGHGQGNALAAIGSNIPLPLPVPDWSKPIIAALLLLALGLGLRGRLARTRARRLEGQRASLLRDVGFMQAALVPEIPARLGGLAVSVAYRPAEGPAAGGDFYDVFVPSPGRVAVILGDVAGHGHEALREAALIRYTLRAYIQAGLDPRAALGLAGRALERPQGENFATIAVGIYDRRGSRLTYSLAGHPPPIFQGFDAPEPLTICSSPPIGWTMPTGRRQTTVTLPAGSRVCFFSDGLVEARTADGLLGRESLDRILRELAPQAQASELLEGVSAAASETRDDMAACILSPEDGPVDAAVRVEELEVGTREIASGDVQHFIEACRVPRSAIVRTIGHAFDIASASGTVLLRIEITAAGSTVTASPPPAAVLLPVAVPEPGAALEAAPLPAAPAARRDPSGERHGPEVAIPRRERRGLGKVPLRRASDREPTPTGPAISDPR